MEQATGGRIVWFLHVDDKDFTRAMENARKESAKTGEEVDRSFDRSMDRAKSHLEGFRRSIAVTANSMRNFSVVARGFNFTAIVLGAIAATGIMIELAAALAAAAGAVGAFPGIAASFSAAMGTAKIATIGLGDAINAVVDGDMEDLAEAMAKLSPAARDFVSAISEIKPVFKEMQLNVQEAAFQGMGDVLRNMTRTTLPLLNEGFTSVARSLNRMAVEASVVMQEPLFQGMLRQTFEQTAQSTDTMTKAVRPLLEAFSALVKITLPYTERLAQWIVDQSNIANAFLNSAEGAEKFKGMIETGIDAIHKLGDLMGSTTGLMVTLFRLSNESGLSFIDTLITIIDNLNAWLNTEEGKAKFQSFLSSTNTILLATAEVVGKVADAIITIVDMFESLPGPVKGAITSFLAWSIVLTPIVNYFVAIFGSIRLVVLGMGALGRVGGEVFKFLGFQLSLFSQGFASAKVAASAFSGFMGTLGGLANTAFTAVRAGITAFQIGMAGMAASGGFLTTVMNGIGIAIRAAFIATPIGWIVLAISAVVAAFIYLWNNVEGFRNFWIGVWNGLVSAVANFSTIAGQWWQSFTSQITNGLNGIGSFFVSVWNGISSFFMGVWNGYVAYVTGVWNAITTVIGTAVANIISFLQPVFQIISFIGFVFQSLFTIVVTVFTAIGQIIWTVVSTIVQIIGVVLYGSFLWLWNNVLTPTYNFFVTVFTNIWNFLVGIFSAIAGFISSVWNGIVNVFMTVVNMIWSVVSTAFNNVMNTINSVMNTILGVIRSVWSAIWGVIGPVVSTIVNFVVERFNNLVANVTNTFNAIRNFITNAINGAAQAVSGAINNVVNFVRNGMNNAYNAAANFVGQFTSAGRNVIQGLVNGIQSGSGAVVEKVKSIAAGALDAVKSFFGIKSPSRVMAKMGDYIMQGLNRGIVRTGVEAINSATSVSGAIAGAFSSLDGSNYAISAQGAIDASMAPISASDYAAAENMTKRYEYTIGEIHIGSEVDGDAWLQKLTHNQEIISNGMTPQTRYN